MQGKTKRDRSEASDFQEQVNEAIRQAGLSGQWEHPVRDAATDYAEMTTTDWAYLCYKLKTPVMRAERNVLAVLFKHNRSVLELPPGFRIESEITISAAGDLIPLDGMELSKDILFAKVAESLFDADISFANLEAPVTQKQISTSVIAGRGLDSPPLMCCSPDQFFAMAGHREKYFTALSLANNHSFDMGIEGLETTQYHFEKCGIVGVGMPSSPEAHGRGVTVTKAATKIGFVSVTFGLNGHQPSSEEKYRVHTARISSKFVKPELDLLRKQIDDCKSQGCHFIVASLHWGYEYEFFPRQSQIDTAHTLIEDGVDLILGHHPHVIQPIEYYRPKRDPDRVGLIAYSLGGLTSWRDAPPHVVLGLILRIKLAKGSSRDTPCTYISGVEPIPVFWNCVRQGDTQTLQIEKLSCARSSDERNSLVGLLRTYSDLVLNSP
ncbi:MULTISPECIES: CapA family protein [unclassified Bradyrhizobium]|uniref:CapA family protein n=1 Tax=unclassified Bradyrhizobium TaxID=2631580 RepID=UPI001FFA7039|nr:MULTISPECIES: CapA family protein [unclassified Bradyrhizobium]MCK1345274.1 CapA family protein [Bradyrhizobium sp. CW11]MCK1707591.1 CapA family protein [Bradyrhizobium sp. 146]